MFSCNATELHGLTKEFVGFVLGAFVLQIFMQLE